MSREIKFRFYDKESKCMRYFTLDDVLERKCSYQGSFDLKALRSEKTQFTGIKDKNGKEIYEGDIVIFHQQAIGSLIEDDYTGIVKFQECCFTADNEKKQESVPIFDEIGMWEVIGNIVEDEDLVNQIK